MRAIGSLLMLSLPAVLLAGLIVSGPPGAAAAEKTPSFAPQICFIRMTIPTIMWTWPPSLRWTSSRCWG